MIFRKQMMAGEVLTLAEAATYLRFSKSTMYQRKDIPRHRIPGSRGVRFFKDELTAWLKGPFAETDPLSHDNHSASDTSPRNVYHRNPRYR